jgi:hypothetical protein
MEPIGFKTQSNYKNTNECWDASILWAKQIERQLIALQTYLLLPQNIGK